MKTRVSEVKSTNGKETFYQIQRKVFFWWEAWEYKTLYGTLPSTFTSEEFAEASLKKRLAIEERISHYVI